MIVSNRGWVRSVRMVLIATAVLLLVNSFSLLIKAKFFPLFSVAVSYLIPVPGR